MKRFPLILLAVCVMLLLAAAPLAGRHPFRGLWRGTDVFDGSTITFRIIEEARSGGRVFTVNGSDDRTGPWCGGTGEMEAIGVLEGENSMAVSLVWWCLADPSSSFYFLSDTFVYDPAADTITTLDGSVYYRGR
jgi:hypothetical protein